MIAVSKGWRAASEKTLLPEMFVEVNYTVTEPGLQNEAVASGIYADEESNTAQVVGVEESTREAYATLDWGLWGLDGGYSYSNGSPLNPGHVDSNYSTEDGSMDATALPTISIDFPRRRDTLIPGLTITWSKVFSGWATEFRITAYNADTVVAQRTIVGNTSIKSTIWIDLVEYTNITIEVLKWSHPYQRVRCSDIRLGIDVVYTKSDLLSYEHKQLVDLLSATLPNSEIRFSLRNDDGRWNPDNPSGSERYLLEQQEVNIRYGMDVNGDIEWIKGGTYWLSEWSTPSNGLEASFTAKDAIALLAVAYTGIRVGTLYEIAVAAFEEASIPTMGDGSNRYHIDESLKDITTDFSEDTSEYMVADILQMVAHAGCCVFYQDRDGIVRIEPRSRVYSGYRLEPKISFAHPEYTINKPLKSVSVGYGENRAVVTVDTKGEVQTVDNILLKTEADALRVGEHAKDILENRKVISGDFRADMSLDVLDNIIVVSKYASNVVGLTELTYSTTGGAFRGNYVGRVVSVELSQPMYYMGELYSGEIK